MSNFTNHTSLTIKYSDDLGRTFERTITRQPEFAAIEWQERKTYRPDLFCTVTDEHGYIVPAAELEQIAQDFRDDTAAMERDEADYDAWNNEQNRKHYEMLDAIESY